MYKFHNIILGLHKFLFFSENSVLTVVCVYDSYTCEFLLKRLLECNFLCSKKVPSSEDQYGPTEVKLFVYDMAEKLGKILVREFSKIILTQIYNDVDFIFFFSNITHFYMAHIHCRVRRRNLLYM